MEMITMNQLEEETTPGIDFDRMTKIAESGQQVVPVVLQNDDSREVLFIAYANREALEETLRTRRAVLWSTSRNELWRKGETSGDVLELVAVRVNCEQNSLLYLVNSKTGAACHTRDQLGRNRPTCYYRQFKVDDGGTKLSFVENTA